MARYEALNHDGNKQATSVSLDKFPLDGCCSFLIFIPISTSSPAATMVQAAYRGHRARRGFSAVRTSHDGKPPAVASGHLTAALMATRRRARRSVSAAQNSHDGNKQATSFSSHDGNPPAISAGNFDNSHDAATASFDAAMRRRQRFAGYGKPPNCLESNRPATSSGHLTISLDGNQPTILVGNLLASPAGIKHAEPGHSGGSSLSATAKVFLSNAAMQAHTEPEQACLNSMFWPPDVNADADSAPTATES